jgi:DNA-binding HxlR family transcriptional regulator
MTRTDEKVRYPLKSKDAFMTPADGAEGVENVLRILEGRWKLVILFHLFGGAVLRFSELERAIPGISQKMLIQQLRQMESDGVVRRDRPSSGAAQGGVLPVRLGTGALPCT